MRAEGHASLDLSFEICGFPKGERKEVKKDIINYSFQRDPYGGGNSQLSFRRCRLGKVKQVDAVNNPYSNDQR
jgi:hypothetical protein